MQPVNFPYIDRPKKITLEATTKALTTSFKEATITQLLTELSKQPEFIAIEERRNILAHRLSGRRSVGSSGTVRPDGKDESTWEERWYMPGSDETLAFDEECLGES